MSREVTHEMLATAHADDRARQRWVLALKGHIGGKIRPANWPLYEQKILPQIEAELGRPPTDTDEIRTEMNKESIYLTWGALLRASQDQMWSCMEHMIDDDEERLRTAYLKLSQSNDKKGSQDVDPGFKVPSDVTLANIHGQPGGYGLDRDADDIKSGALYELGGNLYSQGQGISIKESKGYRVAKFIRKTYPEFEPKRILELGCSAGGQTIVYVIEFPDADMHALDAGPGHIRYAHARAESMGLAIHFHVMDAAHTRFPDGHFDMIVSHNLFHEVSTRAAPSILVEAHRLLAPGGILINQDLPVRANDLKLFDQFMVEYEKDYNDEPFFIDYMEMDFNSALKQAGFDERDVFETHLKLQQRPGVSGPGSWYIFGALKSPV